MIDESVKRKYQDIVLELNYGSKYEIVLEKLFYKQFNDRKIRVTLRLRPIVFPIMEQ